MPQKKDKSAAAPAPLENEAQLVPGGEESPTYRWAFNAFVLLFLLQVCVGLIAYLGWYFKVRTS